MVEFYQPKKRRGIASQKTTRVVAEAKPYWPGLEIDDYDRKKANPNSVNGVTIPNIDVNTNPYGNNGNCVSKNSSANDGAEKTTCANSGEISIQSATGEDAIHAQDSHFDNSRSKSMALHRPLAVRSRKRRRKEPTTDNNDTIEDMPPSSSGPANYDPSMDEQKGNNDLNSKVAANYSNAAVVDGSEKKKSLAIQAGSTPSLPPVTLPVETTTTTTRSPPSTIHGTDDNDDNDNAKTVAKDPPDTCVDGNENEKRLSIRVPLVLRVETTTRLPSGTNDCTNDDGDNTTKALPSNPPTILVDDSEKEKRPIRWEASTVLSPAITHPAETTKALPSRTNDCNKNDETDTTTTNDERQNESDLPKQIQDAPQREQQTLATFEELCKRHEKLLDRMDGLEQATSKREQAFLAKTQEQQSHERLVKELQQTISKLKHSNVALQEDLQDVEESKKHLQKTFYSRVEEQFRELAKRDAVIEKQKRELEEMRLKNKRLKKAIEAAGEDHPSSKDLDATSNRHAATSTSSSEAAFTSHRSRHRHPNAQSRLSTNFAYNQWG